MIFFILLGVIGALSVLAGYGLLSTGKWQAHEARYQWLNVLGTLAILASLLVQWNLPSFLLNAAWVMIGIVGLVRIYRTKAGGA